MSIPIHIHISAYTNTYACVNGIKRSLDKLSCCSNALLLRLHIEVPVICLINNILANYSHISPSFCLPQYLSACSLINLQSSASLSVRSSVKLFTVVFVPRMASQSTINSFISQLINLITSRLICQLISHYIIQFFCQLITQFISQLIYQFAS